MFPLNGCCRKYRKGRLLSTCSHLQLLVVGDPQVISEFVISLLQFKLIYTMAYALRSCLSTETL